jgi:gliding motility-associated-like protein
VTPKSGDCVGDNFTVTVTVKPKPAIANKTYTICSDDQFTYAPVASDVVPAGTTYTWTVVDNTNVDGDLPQTSASTTMSQTLINNSATAQTVTYTVTPEADGSVGDNFTVTVTVNPKAKIANKDYTRCTGEPFTLDVTGDRVPAGTTYTWIVAANANVSGQSAQATGVASMTQTLTNATATVQTVVYTVTPKSGDCVGDDFTVIVTVNPKAKIANKTYTICSETAFTFATVASDVVPAGTTYSWTKPVNVNVTGQTEVIDATSMSQTLTNSTNTAQKVVYTVTPKSGSCEGDNFTVTVTVNPKPVITVNPAADVCNNLTVDLAATFNSNVSGSTFAYYTDAAGTSPASVTTAKWNASAPNQAVDQTTTLYAIATANGCPSEIASSSVTIKHKPVAPTVENIRECAAVTPEAREWASLVSNVEANAELKWYNGSAAVTPADFDMSVAMNKAYSVTQTVNGCESDKSMVEVHIKPLPEAPMVTNNVVCEGVGSKAWRDLVTSRVDGGVKTWFSDINGTAQIAEPITISFSKPGERTAYVAIEKDGCLSEIVEVSSSVHETPSFAEVIDESDESTTLRVNGVAPFTYLLDKNIREQFDGEVNLGILSIGNHPLTVSDEIGCKRDTVLRIEPIPLVPDKFFTPNGDGVNDKWTIKGLERYPETKIFLHDRYGKELAEFKAKDFDGWDGKYNGEDMPSTDYWYIIELRETGKRMVGHFLLRR